MSTPQAVPSIGRLRSRAENLVKQVRSGDVAAAKLFQAHHPDFAELSTDDLFARRVTLAQAQIVIARMNGFASWSKLKQHYEEAGRAATAHDRVVQDAISWMHRHPNATLLSLPYNTCNAWLETPGSSSRARNHNDRCMQIFLAAFTMVALDRMRETGQANVRVGVDELHEKYQVWQTKLGLRRASYSLGSGYGVVVDAALDVYRCEFADQPLFNFDYGLNDSFFGFYERSTERERIANDLIRRMVGPTGDFCHVVRQTAGELTCGEDWDDILILDPEMSLHRLPHTWLRIIDPSLPREGWDRMCIAYFTAAYTLYGDGRYAKASVLTFDGSVSPEALGYAVETAKKLTVLPDDEFGLVFNAFVLWSSKFRLKSLREAASLGCEATGFSEAQFERLQKLGFADFDDQLLFDFEIPEYQLDSLHRWATDEIDPLVMDVANGLLNEMGLIIPPPHEEAETIDKGLLDAEPKSVPLGTNDDELVDSYSEAEAILAQETVNLRPRIQAVIQNRSNDTNEDCCLYGCVYALIVEHIARAQAEIEYLGVSFEDDMEQAIWDSATRECPDAKYFRSLASWISSYGAPALSDGGLDEEASYQQFLVWIRNDVVGDFEDDETAFIISRTRLVDPEEMGELFFETSIIERFCSQHPEEIARHRAIAEQVGLINLMNAFPTEPIEANTYTTIIRHPMPGMRSPDAPNGGHSPNRAERRRKASNARKRR